MAGRLPLVTKPCVMKPIIHKSNIALVFGTLILILAGCALAGAPTPAPTLVNQYGTPVPAVPTLDAAQVARGKQVYQTKCASCHGTNAGGAPNWNVPDTNGNYPPPPHNDDGHTWHHSDRVLYEMIRDGMRDPLRPDSPLRMPAFGDTLSDADVHAVIAYFKNLWNREHQEFQWIQTTEDFQPTPTLSPH